MRSRFRASPAIILALVLSVPVTAVCAIAITGGLGHVARDAAAQEPARTVEPPRPEAKANARPPAPRLLSVEVIPDGAARQSQGTSASLPGVERRGAEAPPVVGETDQPGPR